MGRFYRNYADFLAEHFTGKMQKLTVNIGLSCPNRDGTVGRGGCVYCNNTSFSPNLGNGSVSAQLNAGKAFFARKYPEMRYLAYFQSYTNTYGPTERLMAMYREALDTDAVDGLIIGTRPDCMPDHLLDALSQLGKPVFIEYGAESSHNTTLAAINRCHTWEQTEDAVWRTHAAGLPVGLHFIMGLPGEDEDMMLQTVSRAAKLPVSTVKFHQLQIIAGTPLAKETESLHGTDARTGSTKNGPTFRGPPVKIFGLNEYIDLCVKIVTLMRKMGPHIAIERFTSQAPAPLLLAPRWGIKNYQFVNLLNKALENVL